MNTDFKIKTEDEHPVFEKELGENLSSVGDVRFYMENEFDNTLVVNSSMEVTDASNGIVQYQFTQDETAREGYHLAEIVVEHGDGKESFPKDDFYLIKFSDTLDRTAGVEPAEAGATIPELTVEGRALGGMFVHRTHIPADMTFEVPENYGTIVAGPLTGEGEITGEGTLKII